MVVSSASPGDSGGRIVGIRRASIVFPEPGAPIISTLCPPAAAISSARLASACPFTSAKSSSYRPAATSNGSAAPGTAGTISASPFSSAITSFRLPAPSTSIPSTTAASRALSAGSTSLRNPSPRARTAIGSTPRTGFSVPSSDSSPANIVPPSAPASTRPIAASIPTAIGRSNEAPSLRRSAGARLTTTLRPDIRSPEFSNAARMRCSLSLTALSGSPTRYMPSPPPAMLTSTVTATASIPTIAPA